MTVVLAFWSAVCWLRRGHRPYYAPGQLLGTHQEGDAFGLAYGPGFRYCGRCGDLLPGSDPQVGDIWRIS